MWISRGAERVIGTLAIVALIAGCVLVGVARSMHRRFLYISELGAVGMASAQVFQVGFAMVAVGIALVALVVRHERSRWLLLGLWAPAISLLATALLFGAAAVVPCSWGCPSLLSNRAQLRDAVHVTAAVLAFAAGCVAMLQFASSKSRVVARVSALSGVLVALIATAGGLISLARGNTDIGSTLEYVAAGLGVAWLIAIVLVRILATNGHRRPTRLPMTKSQRRGAARISAEELKRPVDDADAARLR